MKITKLQMAAAILSFAIGGFSTPSRAQQHKSQSEASVSFKFENISVAGAAQLNAYAINNKKEIAGDYVNAAGVEQGVLLKGAKGTSVNCGAGESTVIYGENQSAHAVVDCGGGGELRPETGLGGYIWYAGRLIGPINCECPGPEFTVLNDSELVVGYFEGSGQLQGLILNLQTDAFTSLSVPGTASTIAWGINDAGLITLQATNPASGLTDSYLYNGQSYTEIDVPGALQSFAYNINKNGDIVYSFVDANQNSHGALYLASTGQFFPFDDPNGPGTTSAFGINDEVAGKTSSKLEIVGEYAIPGTSQSQSYMATVTIKP